MTGAGNAGGIKPGGCPQRTYSRPRTWTHPFKVFFPGAVRGLYRLPHSLIQVAGQKSSYGQRIVFQGRLYPPNSTVLNIHTVRAKLWSNWTCAVSILNRNGSFVFVPVKHSSVHSMMALTIGVTTLGSSSKLLTDSQVKGEEPNATLPTKCCLFVFF